MLFILFYFCNRSRKLTSAREWDLELVSGADLLCNMHYVASRDWSRNCLGPPWAPMGPKIGQNPGAGFIILSSLSLPRHSGGPLLSTLRSTQTRTTNSPAQACLSSPNFRLPPAQESVPLPRPCKSSKCKSGWGPSWPVPLPYDWFERIFEMQIWLGPELARSRFVWKLAKQIMLKGG